MQIKNVNFDLLIFLHSDLMVCVGYRYEYYCASKSCKTTQVTVECAVSESIAWEWNEARSDEDKYSREAFEALKLRCVHNYMYIFIFKS